MFVETVTEVEALQTVFRTGVQKCRSDYKWTTFVSGEPLELVTVHKNCDKKMFCHKHNIITKFNTRMDRNESKKYSKNNKVSACRRN